MDLKIKKCKLKSIIKSDSNLTIINGVVNKANKLMFICSHFIRAFILEHYKTTNAIPDLNKGFILTAISVLKKPSRGPKKRNNLDMAIKMEQFYRDIFVETLYPNTDIDKSNINNYKFDASNLSYIINYSITELETAYKNNIQKNYVKYVRQFVNEYFKNYHNNQLKKAKGETLKELKKQQRINIINVKKDIFNGTSNSKGFYLRFLTMHRKNIIISINNENPKELWKELKKNPLKFMSFLCYMNTYLEKRNKGENKCKTFQPIPIRTDIKDKYITIDTKSLIDILPFKNKKILNDNPCINQHKIWNKFVDLNKNEFKKNKYAFNYLIHTDGYAVSISFINRKDIAYKKYINDKKKGRKIDVKLSKPKKIDDDNFIHIGEIVKKKDMLKDLKEKYSSKKFVFIDPGKRDIGKFMSQDGDFLTYSNKRRLRETKRMKYNQLIKNKATKTLFSNNKSINDYEQELAKYSKKSMNINNYLKYFQLKYAFKNKVLNETNYNNYLKKLNWYSYINRQKHESKIVNEIKNKFGEESVIIIGDWSKRDSMKGFISTPNIGFKRLISKNFETYLIDEFRTSKINCKTKEEHKNLYLDVNKTNPNKNTINEKKMHAIFTYKMGNRRFGCINRDVNAVLNMKHITEELLRTQKRPVIFSRQNKEISKPLKKGVKLGTAGESGNNQLLECTCRESKKKPINKTTKNQNNTQKKIKKVLKKYIKNIKKVSKSTN